MNYPIIALCLLGLPLAGQPLLVAAAADLSPAEAALTEAWQARSGERVRFVFGSSGMLAEQIRRGAPFDVYLSANVEFVSALKQEGRLVPGSDVTYANGRLGLWSSTGTVRSLQDLTGRGVQHIAIANPRHAPYGRAAEQLLRRAGLWEPLQGKLVYGENVRQAFEYARTGNCDAVITAWSLVFDRAGVLLAAEHEPIRQAGGVVQSSSQRELASQFLQLLQGPEGRRILSSFGLFPASDARRR